MTTLQAWLIVGVPVLVTIAALFTGRSALRATLGYLLLAGTFVFLVAYVGDTTSAAVLGTVGALMIATGRGTEADDTEPEHHENRKRFTTVAQD